MRRFLYNYPFLFIFAAVAGFAFYMETGNAVYLIIFLIILLFLRFRVFFISLVFILTLYLLYANTNNKSLLRFDSNGMLRGEVYDIRENRRLTFYVKSGASNIYLFVPKLYDNIYPYEHIAFRAKIKSIDSIKNSGFKRYLAANDIYFIGYASYIHKLKNNGFAYYVMQLREKLEKEFYYFLDGKEYIFIQNAIFGDSIHKSRLRKMFINTQTAHIMSVSGLHMGFVFGLFYLAFYFFFSRIGFVFRRFNLKTAASVFAFFPTLFYFALSGMHIPAIRSFLMVLVFVFALIYGYVKNSYNILFFIAASLPMLFGYKLVFNPSFVMSFFMSFAAIYIYGLINKTSDNRIVVYIAFSLLMSVFAMPISAFYFHKLAYLSFLSNFIVVPYFGFVIMPLSFAAVFFSLLPFFYVKYVMFFLLNLSTSYLLKIVEYFAQIQPLGAHITTLETAAIYTGLFLLCAVCSMFIKRLPHHQDSLS